MYRRHYGDALTIVGDRAIALSTEDTVPREPLKHCIGLALSYHLRKRVE